jgi:heptaprenyl diphosphate synthase
MSMDTPDGSAAMTITPTSIDIHSEVLNALAAGDAERAAPGIFPELEATLAIIDSNIVTEVDELTDVTAHLFTGASKLIRPILLLLTAATGEGTVRWADSARTMAAVIEIVHVATLYHDDVMDEAASRRGLPSANSRFGNKFAVIAGDLLLSRALEMACAVGVEQCSLVSRTVRLLCQGQALEVRDQYSTERTLNDYLRSIASKTAELFSAACAAGAIEGQFGSPGIRQFAKFGRSLGLAFQIVDDIQDLCLTEAQAGKPTMNDIREGVYTLPVIEALRRDRTLKRDVEATAAGAVDIFKDEGAVEALRTRIIATGAVEYAKTVAGHYISDAVDALDAVSTRSASIATLQAMALALAQR